VLVVAWPCGLFDDLLLDRDGCSKEGQRKGELSMRLGSVSVDTLLQGYRLDTNHGAVAFCAVNLLEGSDEAGVLRRIVVDTGHTGLRPSLQAALAERGLTCSDIDVLVCTHAHWDHIENLDLFDRAEILLHKNERRYARRPHRNDFGCPAWIDAVLERYGDRIREVEEGVRPIPGVEVVDAPGHSAGTIALSARTDEGIAVIAGDSVQNSTVAVERRNALVFWDNALASRTIDKLVKIADVIYPGHDQAFRLDSRGNVEYLQQLELTLVNARADQPGLSFDPGTEFKQVIMAGIEEQRLTD
jgi:glyoxylase-like metal-dependent hydrolase (beta-lactamase superfamily II)